MSDDKSVHGIKTGDIVTLKTDAIPMTVGEVSGSDVKVYWRITKSDGSNTIESAYVHAGALIKAG